MAWPIMGPTISNRVRINFASDATMRIQISWLAVIAEVCEGDFAMVLITRGSFPGATCQTFMMEEAVTTSVPLGPPWLWWNNKY